MSRTETVSGASPSTALATRLVIAGIGRFGQRLRRGGSFTSTLALAGWRAFGENRFLRKGNVHPRLLHLGDRHDRTLQLAFERAPIIDVFGEIGHAEIGLIENLEADAAALRHAGAGHFQAQLGHLSSGTEMVEPLFDSRYGVPSSFSFWTTIAASSGARELYSGRKAVLRLPVREAVETGCRENSTR